MNRFWSPLVHTLTPYVPGEQPRCNKLIKLNTNELPYGPSPKALEAIRQVTNETLRLYPDPESSALREALAQRVGLSSNYVFVGNGSDEVLGYAFLALLAHGQEILFPDITYGFYKVYCHLYKIPYRLVPLNTDMALVVDDYIAPCSGIVIANPNAPTGRAISINDIRRLLTLHQNRVIIVDEAYVDFGAQSAVPLVREYPNLLVVQTFSKSRALAGLRVGFAFGQPELIEGLIRVKNSFNSYPLDRLAQAGALASLQDEEWFTSTISFVIRDRTTLISGFKELGFIVLPSEANFIYVQHPHHDAAKLTAFLRQKAIIVRHFTGARTAQWLRITVGTEKQCMLLLATLRAIICTPYS